MNFSFGKMDILYANEEGFINYNRSQKQFKRLHGNYEKDVMNRSGIEGSNEGEIKKVRGIVSLNTPDDQDWLRNKLNEIDKSSSGRELDVVMQIRKGGIDGISEGSSSEIDAEGTSSSGIHREQEAMDFTVFINGVDHKYFENIIKQATTDWDLTLMVYDGEYGKIKKETMEFIYEKIKKFAKKKAGENLKTSPSDIKYFIIHIIVGLSRKEGRPLKDVDLKNFFKKYPTQVQKLWNVFKSFIYTITLLEKKIATSRERGASEAERDLRKLKIETPDI